MHLPDLLCASGYSLAAARHFPAVQRASFSIPDMMFLTVIALIVFGPKKLPEISRQLGKLVFEFRRASNDFKLQIEEELRLSEEAERQKQIATPAPIPLPETPVMNVDESLAAANAATPTIMPPGTGEPVSSEPPNRAAASWADHAAMADLPETSAPEAAGAETGQVRPVQIEEVQTEVQAAVHQAEEIQEAQPLPVYATEGDAAATHHG